MLESMDFDQGQDLAGQAFDEDNGWLQDGIEAEDDLSAGVCADLQESGLIRVKYNGEERQVSLKEAPVYIQKGMNYDHVKQELDALRESRELRFLDGVAREHGVSRTEAVDLLEKMQREGLAAAYAQTGHDLPTAGSLAQMQMELSKTRQSESQLRQALEQYQAADRETAAFEDFARQYPNVQPEQIPAAVWDAVEQGVPMVYAYAAHQAQSLREEAAMLRQENENLRRGVGSVGSDAPLGNNADPFLAGFWGRN